jgi:L-2-hydroxyglutarate oxidase
VRTGVTFLGAEATGSGVRARVTAAARGGWEETVTADALVVCAGLHADRAARACGIVPAARIVPFRGEYFDLVPVQAARVRALVYPVPDPRFPFLGVHLTRGIHGDVHAGPNAVLALAREGYRRRDLSPGDLADVLAYRGLWRLVCRYGAAGAREVVRSSSRALFARSVARLLPGVQADDLVPAPAGVRAQAVRPDGRLVDDFLVQTGPRQVHVLNAPSPAATASLEIAKHIEEQLLRVLPDRAGRRTA